MSSEELVHHGGLDRNVYSACSTNNSRQEERGQQGIRKIGEPESLESPKDAEYRSDVVGRLETSQKSQSESTGIDPHTVQEYISRLPEALVPEFALLLAQRMKQQVESSDNFREADAARLQAESGYELHTEARELGPRYIVTPDPINPAICIKQNVGEPEVIPYLPPGVYRENKEGVMELETTFRRSVVEPKGERKGNGPSNPFPAGLTGGFRKLMGKIFKGPNGK